MDTSKWGVYDSDGGNGMRRPSQITVQNGAVTITGVPQGNNLLTGGMQSYYQQKYGLWEARMKATPGAHVHPVLLLWPYNDVWPQGGEVDYVEADNGLNQPEVSGYLHYGANNDQSMGELTVDMSQWHVYGVDWSPQGITYLVDGKPWFHDANPAHQPPAAMRPTIQLDYSGSGTPTAGSMTVDWLRVYR